MGFPVTTLNRKNRLPLYYQLKNLIEARIEAGEWKPDTQLPSERELCDEFKISRITVRQAIAELVTEGRLVRAHGRGTFVARPQVEQRLSRLTGFTQDMQARGQRAGAQVLQLEATAAPPSAARALRIQAGEPVILLRRLRLADGEPMAIEAAYLLDRLCHDILTENLENRSLYKLLNEAFGLMAVWAEQQLRAIACPGPEAKLLGIRKGDPVLHIHRTTFNQDDVPFEHVESFYRGDKYVFYAQLNHE
jgi:GntR family transcriptional regulator